MENYLNIIHFCFYKVHYRSHLFVKRINPFNFIHKLPFQKKIYKELGINIHKEIDAAFSDNMFGLSVTVAGGILWGGIALLFITLLLLLNVIVSLFHVILCGISAAITTYEFVFKNDKYIEYFKKYEKWSRKEQKKYSIMTIFTSLIVLFLFLLSLKFSSPK